MHLARPRGVQRTIGALLLGASLTLSPGVASAQAPSAADLEQAKKHMEAGAAFYNDPSGHKCEPAVTEFAKAYQLSGSTKALRAQAICELELERDGDAIAHFEEFLRLAGDKIDAADRKQVESDLKALKAAVATVVLQTNQPGARLVATRQPSQGYPITNRYTVPAEGLTIGIHPGSYTFTASVDGFPDLSWQADVENGGRLERSLDFQKAPELPPGPGGGPAPIAPTEKERPVPPTVWIFGGLTAALAVPTVIFMVSASSAKGDFDDRNGVGTAAELEDLRSTVVTNNLLADVFLGATVVSAAATAVFYFTRPEVDVTTTGWTLVPAVAPSGGGAVFSATF